MLVGKTIVTSSSVVVDEEHFDWAPGGVKHHPLTAISHSAASPPLAPLSSEVASANPLASAPAAYGCVLRFLDFFSGPYVRSDGLAASMRDCGWKHMDMVDNDGETGGGWAHNVQLRAPRCEPAFSRCREPRWKQRPLVSLASPLAALVAPPRDS